MPISHGLVTFRYGYCRMTIYNRHGGDKMDQQTILKELRESHGYTQEEVAKIIGVHQVHIAATRAESGSCLKSVQKS